MRKIRYNVMMFRDTLRVDKAEVLAGRFIQYLENIMYYTIQKS